MLTTSEGSIYITSSGGYLVFEINGEFDLINALLLKKTIKDSYEDTQKLIINLTKAHYISSTGVGVLLELKRLLKKDVTIILPHTNFSVKGVLDAVCLSHILPIFETIDEFLETTIK